MRIQFLAVYTFAVALTLASTEAQAKGSGHGHSHSHGRAYTAKPVKPFHARKHPAKPPHNQS